ncbi:uncharacterized protein THITE_2149045 [Thermothielavioides terrestris NRRL 8126]|uniref:Uncharacterized protein n=1 Tax=Thermothielavioides terrestris (strain ATCC 38088 / NRRL 8126) TaxID=578455 RepID=G2QR88_THETT|nr:uncharacterized protein THITE_2149045 [Thermothielavioides terrestris NRRL 8126]AEO63342.1 hypothetical protein THITE_2149045 [Thermothielavioides terrestris NRRL 8126]
MDPLKHGDSFSSEPLLPTVAPGKTVSGTQPNSHIRQRPAPVGRMAYVGRAILVLLLCMLVLFGAASVRSSWMPCHLGATGSQTGAGRPELLPSPASLPDPDRFQDGVRASKPPTVEVVQEVDATLASSTLQLARREGVNSTTASVSSSPTGTESSSTPPVDTTPSSTVPPSSASSTISSPSPTSSSSVPPVTNPSSSSSTTTTTAPSSSSPPATSSTTSAVIPTTTPPTHTSKTVVETFTSTSPNGVVVTVTSTAFVAADSSETAAPSSTNSPSLQNAADGHRRSGSILAGAVGLTALLLVV